jgi:uncharacterized iron-regulated membrane protein
MSVVELPEREREGEGEAKAPPGPAPAPKKPRRKWGIGRRWRKFLVVTHRWLALITGIALLAVVLSGVVLTFGPELHQLINNEQYAGTKTDEPISHAEALAALERQDPDFKHADVIYDDDVYSIYDAKYEERAFVDAGTGEVLGTASETSGFMGLMKNIHFCGLSCKDYPGYVPFLNEKVKDSFVPTFGNKGMTWGSLLLGLLGLVLIFLSLGGLWLWWPSIKRVARGFQIRRSTRYKFNYDLHKVVGFAAVPFLIMWGWTGAGFELKQVSDLWYAVLPGEAAADEDYATLESDPKNEDSVEPEAADGKVTSAEAQAIGQRVAGDDARFISVNEPAGKTGVWDLWFSDGSDPYEYGMWPGDYEVYVDQYSGKSAVVFPANEGRDRPVSQVLWDDWNYSVHAGFFANPGWRIFWGVFGMAVLLLAVTSVITWLIRRGRRKRSGKAAGERLAAEAAD